jgi:hypothetical protein
VASITGLTFFGFFLSFYSPSRGGENGSFMECGDRSPLSPMRHVASNQSADVSAQSKGIFGFIGGKFVENIEKQGFSLEK